MANGSGRQKHWVNRVVSESQLRITRSRLAMQGHIAVPQLRRPNTKDVLGHAMSNPQHIIPAIGRDRLAQWAAETYGEAAQHIIPFIVEQAGTEGDSNGSLTG